MAVNHAPEFSADDDAMRRRLIEIPFNFPIPIDQQDKTLNDYVSRTESVRRAVLAWAVQGAVEWHRQGLNPPEKVKQATAAYVYDNDPMAAFIAEECVLEERAWTSSEDFRGAFETFLKEGNRKAVQTSGKGWTNNLARFKITKSAVRWINKKACRGFDGVRLLTAEYATELPF
jgi:putative DNA primase/helicase